MILILVPAITPRLEYTADLIFSRLLGVSYRLTTVPGEFDPYTGPKFIYGHTAPPEGLFLHAAGLLFATEITPLDPPISRMADLPLLFSTRDSRSFLPFDVFASVFYMVSRYEEYLPHEPDRHGRFRATDSIAVQEGFLSRPVVHHWVDLLAEKLTACFPGFRIQKPAYQYVPTIDIDHAWGYLGRGWFRILGGFGRSLMKGDLGEARKRGLTLAGHQKDPFDTYQLIREIHSGQPENLIFFILMADYGGDDNNVTISGKRFSALIRDLSAFARIGIHPSLASGTQHALLVRERDTLAGMLGKNVTLSRQHFLRFRLPDTFNALTALGITDDFSMGYPTHPGFRAGIARPFPFFDLRGNRITELTIHPAAVMDVTFRDQLRLTPQQTLEVVSGLIRQIRKVNGELVTIWHNESLADDQRWKGWREVYRSVVKMATGTE